MATRDEVRNVLAELVKALAEKDVRAAVACYEENGIVLTPNLPMVRGSSALCDLFKGMIDSGLSCDFRARLVAAGAGAGCVILDASGDGSCAKARVLHAEKSPIAWDTL
jgi:ketosteroid isomerase-like protein